jgi:hypothetical protein
MSRNCRPVYRKIAISPAIGLCNRDITPAEQQIFNAAHLQSEICHIHPCRRIQPSSNSGHLRSW